MTTTNAGPSIRPAAPGDRSQVEALLTSSDLPLDGVAEALSCFVVAENAQRIVGVAGIEGCGSAGEHALLRSVAVADEWRGKGLGRELVVRAIGLAEERGVHALYLLTTTAEHYFPTFGFAEISRDVVPDDVKATAEFQGACPASATVMTRTLSRPERET